MTILANLVKNIFFVFVLAMAAWTLVMDEAVIGDGLEVASEHGCQKADAEETAEKKNTTFYPAQPDSFFSVVKQHANFRDNRHIKNPRDVSRLPYRLVQGSSRPFFSCNAPKTGCTSFNYFYTFINDGVWWNASQVKENPGLVYSYKAKTKVQVEQLVEYHQTLDHIVVTRNPYVRFLSSYFDWLFRSTKFNETTMPFANFTTLYVQDKLKAVSRETLPSHIQPIADICRVGQIESLVMRVEEQALWMDEFLQRYDLQALMQNYTNLSGNIVFETGLHAGSLIRDHAASIAGTQAWPTKLFQSSHHRGAVHRLAQYYTPEIARLVTEKQMQDFINFGYPLWNGDPDSFRLV